MSKRYLKIEGLTASAGLGHQQMNLKSILAYAYDRGLTPIIPEFRLMGMFNSGRPVRADLSDYYDYDRVTIKGKPFPVVSRGKRGEGVNLDNPDDIDDESVETLCLPSLGDHGLLHRVLPATSLSKRDIQFPYSERALRLHKEFTAVARLPRYSCVHARRGERLALTPGLDRLTRGENIRRVLARSAAAPRLVYIMTDEPRRKVFDRPWRDKLAFWRRDEFRFLFHDDYELLRRLKAEDNHLLFCVEHLIMEHAAYRVSTHKRLYAKRPHAPFHDSLAGGWSANI